MSQEAGGPRRSAVVTGASVGLGRAFAERLAREQYDLVLVARDAERLGELAGRLASERPIEARALPADLTDPAGLARVEAEVRERTPDLLVNNAGFATVGRFAELDVGAEEREVRLNVLALLRLTHAALRPMVERGHGAVINVSSLAGEAASPFTATYAATKAFVTSFTEALSEELRGSGVRVQALLPGFTRTEFQQRAGIDTKAIPDLAWMEPGDVVEASLAALEKGVVTCIPGLGNRMLAPLQRLLPRSLVRRVLGAALERGLRE
jgi:short-subunit dehydrogenase